MDNKMKMRNLRQHETSKVSSYKAHSANLKFFDHDGADEPEKKIDKRRVIQSKQKKYKRINITITLEINKHC